MTNRNRPTMSELDRRAGTSFYGGDGPNNRNPAQEGRDAASPEAEADATARNQKTLDDARDLSGHSKAGTVADLIGGRLDAKSEPLYLDTAFGILRARYVRQFSDGPWLVTGGSNPLDQRSFAVTLDTALYRKAR